MEKKKYLGEAENLDMAGVFGVE